MMSKNRERVARWLPRACGWRKGMVNRIRETPEHCDHCEVVWLFIYAEDMGFTNISGDTS